MNACCGDLGACTGCGAKDEPRSVDGRCGACVRAQIRPHAWCDGCDREAALLGVNVPHEPVLVYFDAERVTTPAHVCWRCSDPDAGRWVPVSQCVEAAAQLAALDARGDFSATATFAKHDPHDPDDAEDTWERYQDEGAYPSWM